MQKYLMPGLKIEGNIVKKAIDFLKNKKKS